MNPKISKEFDRILFVNQTILRNDADLNRESAEWTSWFQKFKNILKTRDVVWVIDMHSFPPSHEWKNGTPTKIAILDLYDDRYNTSAEYEQLKYTFPPTGRSKTWVRASERNAIMKTARDQGIKSILLEINESSDVYPDSEMIEDFNNFVLTFE